MTRFLNSSKMVILLSVIISAFIWLMITNRHTPVKKFFTSKTFRTNRGWGYDILVNDSLFIHQESIPAMAGENGFQTREQAEKTVQLIINKMKRGKLPSVTTFEMEQILALNDPKHDSPGKSK